ncbi:ATP-binding protein [Ideonella sp. DXS22W]|uniref:histidine kinase n=1 Tax=Pseudaquabacterium inlustre TaxID=2984192 RepID=A0ABU9CM72_9BURK
MPASYRLGAAPGGMGYIAGHQWAPRQLQLGLLALNLVFAAVCAAWILGSYRSDLLEVEAQAVNTALLTEQHASARLDALALGLTAAALQFERQIAQGGIDPATLWAIVDEQTAQMPEAQRLGVFDSRGVQVCGLPVMRCLHLNLEDRADFQQLRAQPDGQVRLFGPQTSRIDGQPALMLGRALRHPGGGFAGAVVMVLPLTGLRPLVNLPDTGSTGVVSLRSPDLRLLMRQPELTSAAPNPAPGAVSDQMRAAVAAAPRAGVYRAVAVNDGIERIVAYRRLARYPLYVMVGQGIDERLAGWRRDTLAVASLLALVALGSWALARSVGQGFRRQAEAQKLYDEAPCGYHTLDAAGRYLSINATELRWLACERGDVLGQLGPRDFLDETGRATFAANFPRLVAGQPLDGLELEITGRDGARRQVLVSAQAVHDKTGSFVCSNSVMHDVTALRQAEDLRAQAGTLAAQNEQLREVNRLKDEFVSNMTHELRTPLNGVLGLTGLLATGRIEPGSPRYTTTLARIDASGRHLLALIDAVLEHTVAEKGRMVFAPAPLDLPALLDDVVGMLASASAERQVRIELQTAEGPQHITADAVRLRQMVLNLLANAVKFSHPGGLVQLRTWPLSDTQWALSVHDHGIGIEPADLPRLFQRYVQLSSGHSKSHPGAGLGLSLVRHIARAQGGEVTVRSMPGEGSTFTLTLPRVLGPG